MSGEKRAAEALKLSCPICLDSLGDPGLVLCIITTCRPVVHYICTRCIPGLPVNASKKALCAECRAPVGAIVPLPATLVDGDAAAQIEHGAAVKRLRLSEPETPKAAVIASFAAQRPRQPDVPAEVMRQMQQLAAVIAPRAPQHAVAAPAFLPAVMQELQQAQVPGNEGPIPGIIAGIAAVKVREVVVRRVAPPEYGDTLYIAQEHKYRDWTPGVLYAPYPISFMHMVKCLNASFPAYRFALAKRSMRGNSGTDGNAFFCLEAHTSTIPPDVVVNLSRLMGRFSMLRMHLLPTFVELQNLQPAGGASWNDLTTEHGSQPATQFLVSRARHLVALLGVVHRIGLTLRVDTLLGFDTMAFKALLTKEYLGNISVPRCGQTTDWVGEQDNLVDDLGYWARQMRTTIPALPTLAAESLTRADRGDLRKLQVAITELVLLLDEHRTKVPRTIDKPTVRRSAGALDLMIADRERVIEV